MLFKKKIFFKKNLEKIIIIIPTNNFIVTAIKRSLHFF